MHDRKPCEYVNDYGDVCRSDAAAESKHCSRHHHQLKEWTFTMREWNECGARYGYDDPRTLKHSQRGASLAQDLGITGQKTHDQTHLA